MLEDSEKNKKMERNLILGMADKHFNNDSYTQKDTEKGKNRGEF
jgi:hypothetical protein